MTDYCQVLLVSGSLRRGSTNTAVLRAAQEVAPASVRTDIFLELDSLPHFNPDDDKPELLPPAVAELRARIAAADAVLFCTPEYAGALPGSFKNLLDWTVGGGETYGKATGWINVSASPSGALDAHDSLRKVLEKTGTNIVESACQRIPVTRSQVGEDGAITDLDVRSQLVKVLDRLADQARASTTT